MKYTEEEKEVLKIIIENKNRTLSIDLPEETRKTLKIIINLLEKQQKEIEEKDKLICFNRKYINELEQDLFENASNYVVPKESIREKIKKLQNDNNKINNEMINCTNIIKMQVLDELLRGE